MIYLITGAPTCGKTILSAMLAKKLAISWLSTNAIEAIIKTKTHKTELDKLFPHHHIQHQTQESNDILYAKYSTDEIVKTYIKQSKAIWTALETMIEIIIAEGRDFIIEGHQIHPQLIAKLMEKYGSQNIRPLVITRFNKSQIVALTTKNVDTNNWFIKTTTRPETYEKIAAMIRQYSQFFDREAKKYKLKAINVDDNFLTTINLAVSKLIKP